MPPKFDNAIFSKVMLRLSAFDHEEHKGERKKASITTMWMYVQNNQLIQYATVSCKTKPNDAKESNAKSTSLSEH